MTKRRSLDDALTPEQEAFIRAESTTPKARAGALNPKRATKETVTAIAANPSADAPSPATAKPELVDLHTRVETWINAALLRASTERKIQRVPPYTQRDIVAEALAKWLEANGYLDKGRAGTAETTTGIKTGKV